MLYLNKTSYLRILLAIKVLNCFSLISVTTDSYISESKLVGQYCWSSNECQMYSHCLKQNENLKHGTCQCVPGYVITDNWIQCVQPRNYNQPCEFSEQCQHFDVNTVCENEKGHYVLKCLCNDFHRYNPELMRCQWCDDYNCRRYRPTSLSPSYNNKYNRWYNNVHTSSIAWASLFIMALPLCIFILMLIVRYARHVLGYNEIVRNPHNQSNHFDIRNELEMLVAMPPEMLRIDFLPPSYEECTKSSQLPTYEEALQMPAQ